MILKNNPFPCLIYQKDLTQIEREKRNLRVRKKEDWS